MHTWLFRHKWTFLVLLGIIAAVSLFQQSEVPQGPSPESKQSLEDTGRFEFRSLPVRRGSYADQRRNVDDGRFYIEFCAVPHRGSGLFWKPGHVFVSFFEESPTGGIQSRGILGMHPDIKLFGISSFFFGPVSGGLKNELYRKSIYRTTKRLIVRVDSEQFEAAWDIQKKWSSVDVYQLIANDCVTFMDEVATTIGLESPPRFPHLLPFDYLEALIGQNTGTIRQLPEH
jgi:hypothetical protein